MAHPNRRGRRAARVRRGVGAGGNASVTGLWLQVVEPAPVNHPTIGSGFWAINIDSVLSSLLAVIVTIAVGLYVARRLQTRKPGILQLALELAYTYVRDDLFKGLAAEGDEEVAKRASFVMPLALTIGFYILIANYLDFLPLHGLIHPANSDLNQTLAMALVVFVTVQWYTFREQGLWGYLYRWTKPFEMPLLARIVFIPLNILEDLIKPVTLSMRLFGNILAAVIVIWLITTLVASIPYVGPFFLAPLALIIWKGFDVFFIGALQAFIFMLLTIIYFGQAREGIHERHRREHAGQPDLVGGAEHS
ncbi:MAG: F0F1 ATP synthase subunit A [Chloroflexi bacterium]|nr:MAG: F0F1 ATP synthase subunit A [Chloroflexota bacterium]TME19408.1 MAG: F0F1 ATP synthase subunit A [Chloroflexota bacterium]